MTQILSLIACAPRWITHPGDDIVGVSEFVCSEQKARDDAYYNAAKKFAKRCGIHVSVVLKYMEEYIKKDSRESDNIAITSDSQNTVDVKVYSLKEKEWYFEKKKKSDNSQIEWKAYLRMAVPTGLEQKIITYQNEKEKKEIAYQQKKEKEEIAYQQKKKNECNDFFANIKYLVAKGQSFDSIPEARKDAINAFEEMVKDDIHRLYKINLTQPIKSDKENCCPDKNKSYYLIGIKRNNLENMAKQEILIFAEQQHYSSAIKILDHNKKLFLKTNDDCSNQSKQDDLFCELVNRFKSIEECIKNIALNKRYISKFEKREEFDLDTAFNIFNELFVMVNTVNIPKNEKNLSEEDKDIFAKTLAFKETLIILKKLKDLATELNSFEKIASSRDVDIFYDNFQIIINKLSDITKNNFQRIKDINVLLNQYNQQFNLIFSLFQKRLHNLMERTEDIITHFEPLKTDQNTLSNVQSELDFFNKNFNFFNPNKVSENPASSLKAKIGACKKLNKTLNDKGFKRIRPGIFLMGSNKQDKEKKILDPLHLVKITQPFYICDHEVTVNDFQEYWNNSDKFITSTNLMCTQRNYVKDKKSCDGKKNKENTEKINTCKLANWSIHDKKMIIKEGRNNHPMNCVSWDEAIKYIDWLNNSKQALSHNYYYHLCTEAQWEYSARGFKCKKISSWKENSLIYSCKDPNIKYENKNYICGNKNSCLDNIACYKRLCKGTCPVKVQTKGNDWGLFDMNGNVDEWVQDKYYCFQWLSDYTNTIKEEGVNITIDPVGEKNIRKDEKIDSNSRIHKGGSYWSATDNMKVSTRNISPKTSRSTSVGIRICVSKRK